MSEKQAKLARRLQPQPDGQHITTDKAREVLLKAQRERTDKCRSEVAQVLKKHQCTISAYMVIKAGQNIPVVEIIPDEQQSNRTRSSH